MRPSEALQDRIPTCRSCLWCLVQIISGRVFLCVHARLDTRTRSVSATDRQYYILVCIGFVRNLQYSSSCVPGIFFSCVQVCDTKFLFCFLHNSSYSTFELYNNVYLMCMHGTQSLAARHWRHIFTNGGLLSLLMCVPVTHQTTLVWAGSVEVLTIIDAYD